MEQGISVQELSARRVVLSLKGRINAVSAPAVKAKVRELVEEGRCEIVCDLGAVGFLDSAGLAALVSGLKATRERGGFLKLVGVNDQVARIFKLTMLDKVFEIHPSVDAALA